MQDNMIGATDALPIKIYTEPTPTVVTPPASPGVTAGVAFSNRQDIEGISLVYTVAPPFSPVGASASRFVTVSTLGVLNVVQIFQSGLGNPYNWDIINGILYVSIGMDDIPISYDEQDLSGGS